MVSVTAVLREYDAPAYIDGDFEPGASDWIPVLDKAAGVSLGRYADSSADQVARAVAAARRAQPGWAGTDAPRRSAILRAFARELEARHSSGRPAARRPRPRRSWARRLPSC